jgi:hypothetical protein
MPTKSDENRVRRAAKRAGYLLRKSHTRNRWADDYGLYVLVDDCLGNRFPGAAAAPNALRRGEGMSLADVERELTR